jgi:tetratricopeptide (TPR) repeat protein
LSGIDGSRLAVSAGVDSRPIAVRARPTPPFAAPPTPSGLPATLADDPRYRVLGEIGRGGMGVVYEAVDRETGERVAIKVLASPREGLLRFKNEYRLASSMVHPNLVSLYDLVITPDAAWFVMEFAPGVDLRRYVRGERRICDYAKLHASLEQILDALDCLGSHGIVHRDLKPSNIKVSSEGHVKLLDFGLAGSDDTPDFSAAMLAGTPTYMSPEQIEGRPLGPAADLYALGAIVYEMMVGEPPFVGAPRKVLTAQRLQYPLPPSDRVENVPPDLELWCLKLLAKRPEDRFAGPTEARAALPPPPIPCEPTPPRGRKLGSGLLRANRSGNYAALRELPLYGRELERARLQKLLRGAIGGDTSLALLLGESGIGKTALAESILEEASKEGCIVLRGACREHESVTYNAFDAVVDAAAATVEQKLSKGVLQREALIDLSTDLAQLGRIFPVVRELSVGEASTAGNGPAATEADRERAFAACRRLVERATQARPLVLLLDDLQWADEDSLQLLAHLLAPPSVRGLLVLGTAWPINGGEQPLARFLQRLSRPQVTQLPLQPLAGEESARIVRAVIERELDGGIGRELDAATAQSILGEACGNPFLLVELSRLHLEEGLAHPTVAEVARRRLELVDADETPLLELAAVAPSPIDADLLRAAMGADSRRMQLESSGLRRLCGLKILREAGSRAHGKSGFGDGERYDFYHHRLREAIRDKIPPHRQRKLHLRLADTFAALRPDDPESLVRELRLGGDDARAAQHAERAAEVAAAKLAHARAAELYRLALAYAVGPDALRLRIRLGEVLEAMALFAEASEHYRKALDEPDLIGLERTRVEAQQANCLLHTGDLERSGRLVEEVLRALGHRPRRARLFKILSVVWLLLRVVFGTPLRRGRRREDDLTTRVRLNAYALAVPHYQFTSRNLEQLEFALRYRLLGARSPSADVRQEAEAMALILFIPIAHLGRFARRRVRTHFRRLEAGGAELAGDRARAWLPLMRALYSMVSGRPDRAIRHFDTLQRMRLARSGYVALQRHNALMLAGEHDRLLSDLAEIDPPRPLDVVRRAYIEEVRGHHDRARRLIANMRVAPDDVPWTHRSLFTYQLVELRLLEGDTPEAVRLARTLLDRIRKGAVSPTTGAFESADAVARAYVAEARRLQEGGRKLDAAAPEVAERCFDGARALLDHAEYALSRMPPCSPPLFAPRLIHDRAIVAMARGRRAEALRLFQRAEERSRDSVIPCFRLRLLEDLLQLLPPEHPQRPLFTVEADHLARHYRFQRHHEPAAWLWVEPTSR